jgi:hypothetical protein
VIIQSPTEGIFCSFINVGFGCFNLRHSALKKQGLKQF